MSKLKVHLICTLNSKRLLNRPQGPLVGTAFETNAVACRTACEAAGGIGQGCDWFTFHPTDGLCVLYDRCPTLDIDSCPSCVSGIHTQLSLFNPLNLSV